MLTVAISTFFALALAGAVLTIGVMFLGYKDKVKAVIMAELGENLAPTSMASSPYRVRVSKPYLPMRQRPSQPVPLRAAA
ncbi:MAG: hypothetical protein V7676_02105 [Parasphingorhabdus sp.]|uniref:hypothetical protein n=1 Tax=Parasphingorhabdus sp. TaxID=2709688 RepID=UPI003003836B